jgi:prepilin-type N-terminal cleavage/methylation domain-containing protein
MRSSDTSPTGRQYLVIQWGARRRFTIIELLVVIAIIAVLAAMLLPALSRSREQARRIVCLGQLRDMALSVNGYSSDFDDFIPPGYNGGGAELRTCQNEIASNGDTPDLCYFGPGMLAALRYLDTVHTNWCPNREGSAYNYADKYSGFLDITNWPNGRVAGGYIHRNDNNLSKLGVDTRIEKAAHRAWVADNGFFFRHHPSGNTFWDRSAN